MYFLTPDQTTLLLGHHDKEIRKKTAEKLISLSSTLSEDFVAPSNRPFKQNEFLYKDSVYDFMTVDSFNSPLFANMTKNKILSTLFIIKDGEDPYFYYRNFKNNSRAVERAVRVMVEAHDSAKKSTNQVNWARSVYESRIQNPEPWLLKSYEHDTLRQNVAN